MTAQTTACLPVHVVAAAVTDAQGRVLIAQRPPGKRLAGGWEFPGGKIEAGETRVEALRRELHEELGIELSAHPRPLMRLHHRYPYGDVLLDMWVVTHYRGEPSGLDGQALRWCTREELEAAEILPADKPIRALLKLPAVLTSDNIVAFGLDEPRRATGGGLRGASVSSPKEALAATLDGSVDFLVLRRVIPNDEITALCESILLPLYCRGIELEDAWALGASGIAAL